MSNVLIVVGNRERADLALRALSHPNIRVEAADKEDQIVAALTGQRFDLAVVGGKIGQRGPLILCEAVRLRQEVPILVLVGDETTEQALAEHMKQARPNVHYIDLRQQGGAEALMQIATQLREAALGILHVPEDPDAAARWTAALTAGAGEEVPTDDVIEPTSDDLEMVEAAIDTPPPTVAQLTAEDLEYAERLMEKTRGIDFRKTVQPLRLDGVDATERKTVMLRERVRELERSLARLAFVYAARKSQFDGSANNIAKGDADRQSLDGRLRELDTQRRDLEQKLGSVGSERTQLDARLVQVTRQLAEEQATRGEKERAFAAMLAQAQEAFGTLREQSVRAIAQYDEQLKGRSAELAQAQQQLTKLSAEIERVREQQQRVSTEREQIVAERAHLVAESGALKGELKAHEEEIKRLRDSRNQGSEQLRTLREQLEHGATIHAQAMQKAHDDFGASEKQWLDKLDKLKSSAATFRDAYQERDKELVEREKSVAQLTAQLMETQKELDRLHDTHRALASVVEAERDTSAVEKRLGSIEDQEAHSSKRIARQLDLLDEIKERLTKQGNLLDTINDTMARRTEVDIANANVGVPTQMAMWLVAKPMRIASAVTTLILLIGIGAVLGVVLTGGEPAAVSLAQAALAPEPDVADAPPAAKAPAEPAPEAVAAPAERAPAEPEVAAAPEVAPPKAEVKGGTEEERKALRKKLMAASQKKSWGEAVRLGLEMRARFKLDWESEWKIAEALRRTGKDADAIEAYRAYAEHYPDNSFTDDALFNAGAMLVKKGDAANGRPLLERVAKDPKSSFAGDAKKILAKK